MTTQLGLPVATKGKNVLFNFGGGHHTKLFSQREVSRSSSLELHFHFIACGHDVERLPPFFQAGFHLFTGVGGYFNSVTVFGG